MRESPSDAASSPGSFGREIKARGVCGSDYRREAVERFASQPQFVEHRVERATLAAMAPEYAFDIERRAVEALRNRLHFRWRDEQEYGFGIDKAADEPGTGDAIDFRS